MRAFENLVHATSVAVRAFENLVHATSVAVRAGRNGCALQKFGVKENMEYRWREKDGWNHQIPISVYKTIIFTITPLFIMTKISSYYSFININKDRIIDT